MAFDSAVGFSRFSESAIFGECVCRIGGIIPFRRCNFNGFSGLVPLLELIVDSTPVFTQRTVMGPGDADLHPAYEGPSLHCLQVQTPLWSVSGREDSQVGVSLRTYVVV